MKKFQTLYRSSWRNMTFVGATQAQADATRDRIKAQVIASEEAACNLGFPLAEAYARRGKIKEAKFVMGGV